MIQSDAHQKALAALRERIRDFIRTNSRDIEDWKEEMSILQTIVGGIHASLSEIEAQSASAARTCPYCTSDNKAFRDTYFDQTCEGCVRRMGKP